MKHHKNVSEEVFKLNFFALKQSDRDKLCKALFHVPGMGCFSDMVWSWNNNSTQYRYDFMFLPDWFCDPLNYFTREGELLGKKLGKVKTGFFKKRNGQVVWYKILPAYENMYDVLLSHDGERFAHVGCSLYGCSIGKMRASEIVFKKQIAAVLSRKFPD